MCRPGIPAEEALADGADPHRPRGVFEHRSHPLFDRPHAREGLGGGIEERQAAMRADPEPLLTVLVQRRDHAVRQATRVLRIVLEDVERVSVEAIQSLVRPEPEEAGVILKDRLHRGL